MADVLVILTILAFFGLCVALVSGCDRVIGPDDDEDLSDPLGELDEESTR
jgi:hypothetical protein